MADHLLGPGLGHEIEQGVDEVEAAAAGGGPVQRVAHPEPVRPRRQPTAGLGHQPGRQVDPERLQPHAPLDAPGHHRLQQMAVGAAHVQEAPVPVDRLAEVAALGPPVGGRAAEARPAPRGPVPQIRRLQQALAVAVEGRLVQTPAGGVGRLHHLGRVLVASGAQAAGRLGGRPFHSSTSAWGRAPR
jgi:hypothetical protein